MVVVLPFAVGRAGASAGLVTAGPEPLQVYLAGLSLGTVVWALAQAVPPLRFGRLGTALVVLAIALGPLLDIAAGRY